MSIIVPIPELSSFTGYLIGERGFSKNFKRSSAGRLEWSGTICTEVFPASAYRPRSVEIKAYLTEDIQNPDYNGEFWIVAEKN